MDFRRAALAGMENDGTPVHRPASAGTSTGGVPLEAKFAPVEFEPQQPAKGGCYNSQRNKLLPIHARNISLKSARAMENFLAR